MLVVVTATTAAAIASGACRSVAAAAAPDQKCQVRTQRAEPLLHRRHCLRRSHTAVSNINSRHWQCEPEGRLHIEKNISLTGVAARCLPSSCQTAPAPMPARWRHA